ncbi:MAG TPA: SAM-dependent methyltransferase [Pseudonocardiaceae bacterium]|jgi:SAM-dependent methyltransferase|nr:SAM-dependent methyltransferase [Pseudonocardiaceae bacterium]
MTDRSQPGSEANVGIPSWSPEGIDWRKPSVARVYDVHLGGAHNFAVDREVAAELARIMPDLPALFRANRSFLRRAVRVLVDSGITQFLDLGSGIPTAGNVHEIAQSANPDCRVVYVDIDPVAVAHSRRILADNPTAEALGADLRRPEEILGHPVVGELLDLDKPVAVLLVAALNFVADEDEPGEIIGRYLGQVPAGSCLVLSHPTHGTLAPQQSHAAAELYTRDVDNVYIRDRGQIEQWLTGLDLLDPGLVFINAWRPEVLQDAQEASRWPQLCCVARKNR